MAGDLDTAALKADQRRLAKQVVLEGDVSQAELVAGFDVAYEGRTGHGALVVMAPGEEEPLETITGAVEVPIPYIPGLLSYREFPVLEALWSRLDRPVDALLVDGSGVLHPRGIGSATHAGVALDVPTVGVTKRRLVGDIEGPVEEYRDTAPIRLEGQVLGYAFLSSPRAKHPILVSPGHRCTPLSALALVERCCTGAHKLPEPIWWADKLAGEAKPGR